MTPDNGTNLPAPTSKSSFPVPENPAADEVRPDAGHQKILDEILRSWDFFRSVAWDSVVPITVADKTRKILLWNAGAEALYGYSEAEAIGRHAELIIPEEKRGEIDRRIAEAHQGRSTTSFETVLVAKGGARIHVSVTLSPVKDRDGKTIGVCGVHKDLTERDRMEKEREAHLDRLKTLNLLTQKIGASLDPGEIFEFVVRSAAELLDVPFAHLFTIEDGMLEMRSQFGGYASVEKRGKLTVGEGATGWAASQGEPYYIEDVQKEPRWRFPERARQIGARSYLGVPLKIGEKVVGVLSLLMREIREFTSEECDLIISFANGAAIAIDKARIYQEEKRANSFLESVVGDNADAIAAADADRRLTLWNAGAETLFGYSEAEALGRDFVDLIIPLHEREEWRRETAEANRLEMIRTGRPVRLEGKRMRKDGTLVPVSITRSPLKLEGDKAVAGATIYRDLTEQKEMEKALRDSEKRFRNIFDHSNDSIFVIDPFNDEIIDANPSACRMLGYSREELLAKSVSSIHPDEMDRMLDFVQSVYKAGHGWNDELTCLTATGELLPAEISASIMAIAGKTYMVAMIRDITERKLAERAKEAHVERLKTLNLLTQRIGASLDFGETLNFIVQSATALLDVPFTGVFLRQDDLLELRASFGDLFSGRGKIVYRLGEGLTGWVAEKGEICSIREVRKDLRLKHSDLAREKGLGSYLGIPLKSGEKVVGVLYCVTHTIRDFTTDELDLFASFANGAAIAIEKARLYEEEKRASNFFESVVGDNADAIIAVNLARRITLWNSGAEAIYGYTRSEALGRPVSMLYSPAMRDAQIRRVGGIFNRASSESFEAQFVRKDGSEVPVSVTISPVKDHNGEVIGLCGVQKDLSYRKRLEKERASYVERLETLTQLTQKIGASLDLGETLDFVVHSAAELLDVPFTSLFIVEDGTLEVRAQHGGNISAEERGRMNIGEGVIGWTAATGKRYHVEDVLLEPRWRHPEQARRSGIGSFLGVPLKSGERVVGVLGFMAKGFRKFTPAELSLCDSFANGAAIAIEKVRRYEEVQDLQFQSENRTFEVLESMVDGFVTIGEKGIIESFNPAAERIFGYTAEEVIGRNVSTLMPNPFARDHDRFVDNYLRTGDAKVIGTGREVFGRRKDGSTFPLYLAVSEFIRGGRRMFNGIVRDITEPMQVREKLREAKEKAEGADRAKSDFLSNVSHEIRSALNTIVGYSDLLLMRPMDEALSLNIERIKEAGEFITRLIEDLIAFDRIEAGKINLELQLVSINDLLGAVTHARRLALPKGFSIQFNLDPSSGVILLDSVRINQVLTNLLDNAIKYSPDGGTIQVRTIAHPGEVWVSIGDEGMGMTPEETKVIFDRFHQLESGRAHRAGGLGIGLSLVRELVALHGGRIWVEGKKGRGSTFFFALPRGKSGVPGHENGAAAIPGREKAVEEGGSQSP